MVRKNMQDIIDIMIGQKFDKLTVIDFDHYEKNAGGHYMYFFKCKCDCGNEVIRSYNTLLFSKTPYHNCGCERSTRIQNAAWDRNIDGPEDKDKFLDMRIGMLTGTNEWRRSMRYCNTIEKVKYRYEYKFVCDCGNEVWLNPTEVKKYQKRTSTYIANCGCMKSVQMSKIIKDRKSGTHNMSHTRLYNTWHAMVERCYYKHSQKYYRYGGRGIKICKEWYDPEDHDGSFRRFHDWAVNVAGYVEPDILESSTRMTIDRIDNNGDYCPENCRFADSETQANNTSRNRYIVYNGERLSYTQWARKYDIDVHRINSWVHQGYSANHVMHNILHKDDILLLNRNGEVVDKAGYRRLVKNIGAYYFKYEE